MAHYKFGGSTGRRARLFEVQSIFLRKRESGLFKYTLSEVSGGDCPDGDAPPK